MDASTVVSKPDFPSLPARRVSIASSGPGGPFSLRMIVFGSELFRGWLFFPSCHVSLFGLHSAVWKIWCYFASSAVFRKDWHAGVCQSLEMGPGMWLHSLLREQAIDMARQLHRDVCLMTTNLDDKYVLCLQDTASKILELSLGSRDFPSRRWLLVPWDPGPAGLQCRWRPWVCGDFLWIQRSARELYWTIIQCSILVPDPAGDSGCWSGWVRTLLGIPAVGLVEFSSGPCWGFRLMVWVGPVPAGDSGCWSGWVRSLLGIPAVGLGGSGPCWPGSCV